MCGTEEAENDKEPRSLAADNRLSNIMLKPGIYKSKSLMSKSLMSRSGNLAAELVCEEESTARLFVNALQIATVPDGYNSGRSYYLQAGSSQLKQEVSSQLQSLVYAARKKAEVQTHFGQAQASVRRVYVSKPFQYGAALLITAVRAPVPRLRRRFRIAQQTPGVGGGDSQNFVVNLRCL